jgi:hypothetical protein
MGTGGFMMKTYTLNKQYMIMQPANETDGEWCLTDDAMEAIKTLKDELERLRSVVKGNP